MISPSRKKVKVKVIECCCSVDIAGKQSTSICHLNEKFKNHSFYDLSSL